MVTQKSRSCAPLLLSLAPSVLPPLPLVFLAAIAVSAWPAPAAVAAAVADPALGGSPASPARPSSCLAAVSPSSATPGSHVSSPAASTKAASPPFGKRASPSPDSLRFRPGPHCLLRPPKHMTRLPPRSCKHLTPSLKTMTPPSHKTPQSPLSKMSLYPVSSQKVPLQPTKPPKPQPPASSASLFPPCSSTSLLKGSPPSNSSNELLSPASTSASPSSPTPRAKTVPVPLLKTSRRGGDKRFRRPRRRPLPHTAGPLFEHQPFTVSWNIPDLVCNRHNISLDTSPFRGVATPAKVPGQFLSLFYTDRLGLYPHVDLASRRQLYGGIPQRGDLKASMSKARADINYYIPSRTSRGLAVIDWEAWRPLWDRNWGTKRIYQTLSVAHAMQANPSLTVQQATEKAKQQFQLAARSLMSAMLAMGRAMRPNHLWGFYLFPNCYNYGWSEPGYTGRCSREVRRQNDELLWLWESSTALYPSVYLQASLSDNPRAALMVRNRVQEALRVSTLPRRSGTAPVFVYARPVFVDQNRRFLSRGDLVSTVGESAAVGASGAVLWGASADYDDQASCESLSSYLSSTLNPYVANVTAAAQLCSSFLCRGSGRCVRKNYNSDHYLHLNPDSFRVVRTQSRYLVLGRPTFADLKALSMRFTCQCYKGQSCTPRTYSELAKALMFGVKQRLHQKSHTLNKAGLDDMQQTSIIKDNVKKNLKV